MTSRQKEAAALKAPFTKRREELARQEPENLPGLEGFVTESRPVAVKADFIWKNAEKVCAFTAALGGYHVQEQKPIGRHHGREVRADILCWLPWKPEEKIVISVKWQRCMGSFEEKIPAEAAKLSAMLPKDHIVRAWVILIGPGADEEKAKRWCEGMLDSGVVKVRDYDLFASRAWCREL